VTTNKEPAQFKFPLVSDHSKVYWEMKEGLPAHFITSHFPYLFLPSLSCVLYSIHNNETKRKDRQRRTREILLLFYHPTKMKAIRDARNQSMDLLFVFSKILSLNVFAVKARRREILVSASSLFYPKRSYDT
jgi:hypothetical protein